jgi:hypothetical protein
MSVKQSSIERQIDQSAGYQIRHEIITLTREESIKMSYLIYLGLMSKLWNIQTTLSKYPKGTIL